MLKYLGEINLTNFCHCSNLRDIKNISYISHFEIGSNIQHWKELTKMIPNLLNVTSYTWPRNPVESISTLSHKHQKLKFKKFKIEPRGGLEDKLF